jgi:hypothetical protein
MGESWESRPDAVSAASRVQVKTAGVEGVSEAPMEE